MTTSRSKRKPARSTGPSLVRVGRKGQRSPRIRVLVTAGPTYEAIDRVRFIGNRSSGRMGIEIAQAAARLGCATTLLLGPTSLTPTHTEHLTKTDTRVKVRRFRSTADLSQLLNEEFPQCDILIMAAAVADYRPATTDGPLPDKLPRSAAGMTLRLEPTPDLVAGLARERLPGQVVVGFALEPEAELMERAQRKLARKSLDFIVANPLETMDAEDVSATVYSRAGVVFAAKRPMKKKAFAEKLMKEIYSFARPRT